MAEGVQIAIGFDTDGHIVSLKRSLEFTVNTTTTELGFSDHDNTVVDAMSQGPFRSRR